MSQWTYENTGRLMNLTSEASGTFVVWVRASERACLWTSWRKVSLWLMASVFPYRLSEAAVYLSSALWGSACCLRHVSEFPSSQSSWWPIVDFSKCFLGQVQPVCVQWVMKWHIIYLMYTYCTVENSDNNNSLFVDAISLYSLAKAIWHLMFGDSPRNYYFLCPSIWTLNKFTGKTKYFSYYQRYSETAAFVGAC